jgi:hypothetical protein
MVFVGIWTSYGDGGLNLLRKTISCVAERAVAGREHWERWKQWERWERWTWLELGDASVFAVL